ncbi:MAG: alpha/beta fold hydrolase [Acidobacteria bacterium]|nr:alpha/beta fold hydrolase [Acidobacteriota bacterium]
MRKLAIFFLCSSALFAQSAPPPAEADFVIHNFHFNSGEALPELKLHYATYGSPQRDSNGRVTNAVMVLHGTGGSGRQFVQPEFAGELFGPGQLLDSTKYFIILPDNIGHGKSSKPSDALHARFPHYDYEDIVTAQHALLTEGLKVDHLRLLMGTSMGCMHSWVWLETYPTFMDAAMPLACQPVQIAGRNRIWRKMLMDAIRTDPGWNNGEYKQQPRSIYTAVDLLLIAGSAPVYLQAKYPTREQADAYLAEYVKNRSANLDANDLLYAVDSSRSYDPSSKLEEIVAPVMFVNSADDFINPPELGIAEREIKRVKRGKFILLPISEQTRGHGTHTVAAVWKPYLAGLLSESASPTAGANASSMPAPAGASTTPTCIAPPTAELQIIKYVEPRFTSGASTRGTVVLSGTVDESGHLRNLDVVAGHPFLSSPIMEAASQWIVQAYCPAGKPVATPVLLSTSWQGSRIDTVIRVDVAPQKPAKKPHR